MEAAIFVLISAAILIVNGACKEENVTELLNAVKLEVHTDDQKPLGLKIFCYNGHMSSYNQLFRHVYVSINSSSDSMEIYQGPNLKAITETYHQKTQSWWWFFMKRLMPSIMSWKRINLDAFQPSYIGIHAKDDYSVQVVVKGMDLLYVGMVVAGILLYLCAEPMSKSRAFYYSGGVSLGLLGSLLIVIYMISRFVPKKRGSVVGVWLLGGSSFLYILKYVWEEIFNILMNHYIYVMGYFVTAAVLSLAFCYWRGPIENYRTLNLMRWTMQILSLFLVYYGIQIRTVGIALICAVVATQYFPFQIFDWAYRQWRYRFPPQRRFLTEEEYIRKGQEETRIALAELRKYCRSPQCDAWKTVSRLKSPSRFASFISGDDHLLEEEMQTYYSEVDLTDDELNAADLTEEDEMDFQLNSP